MKVGHDNVSEGVGSANLLEQMLQAHQQGEVERTDALETSSEVAGAPTEDVASATGALARGESAPADPLQTQMLEIAQRALDGKFSDDRELREVVIAAIVTHRFSGLVPPAQLADITHTLGAALARDPGFCGEIDQALLLAARRLSQPG